MQTEINCSHLWKAPTKCAIPCDIFQGLNMLLLQPFILISAARNSVDGFINKDNTVYFLEQYIHWKNVLISLV